jgi:hypothetical protein
VPFKLLVEFHFQQTSQEWLRVPPEDGPEGGDSHRDPADLRSPYILGIFSAGLASEVVPVFIVGHSIEPLAPCMVM